MKHEHSASMQFGIFFLICTDFRAANAFCPTSFHMTAQTERFQARNNNKLDFVHVSDTMCDNRPRSATTAAVDGAEGMTRASLVNLMGVAVTISLGISVSPSTAAAARSTEELVRFFMSFAFGLFPGKSSV